MKHTLLISLFAFSLINFSAEAQGNITRLELPRELVRNFQMGNNKLPTDLQGSPYLSEAFVPGLVKVNDNTYNAVLRYNAYLDEIQMKNEQNQDIALLKRDYITANFGGKDFAIVTLPDNKQGYVMRLAKGDISLYKRYVKEFVPEQEATSSYGKSKPPRLVDKISYYVKNGDQPIQEIKLRKKDFINTLGEQEVKSYLQENKSKLNTETDAIRLITHLNIS